ncbi:MAG: response regulator [Anaerolineae bacterium]|nr:response regulator [Anaerolineae bacterium]
MKPTKARALIVEDDRAWQQILSEILTDAGLSVDIADSLDDAIPIIRAVPHRLAVLDLSLSSEHHNREGLRALDAVHQHNPGCTTILLTGFATVELAVDVLTEHGAFTCLRKENFRRSEFKELVNRALASAPLVDNKAGTASTPGVAERVSAIRDRLGPALVVEDDAGWRDILGELLGDAGYQPRLCTSFGEALGYLHREKYALAVIDLSLSGAVLNDITGDEPSAHNMDGYRLLASTRAGGVPTIVVSGIGSPEDIERAYTEQGIFAYLAKQTFDRHAFLQTLKEARSAGISAGELAGLTDREREVLDLLAQGMTNKEIAGVLVITTNTVKRHLKSIFSKLDIHTRSAATAKAIGGSIATDPSE